ncbi:hypothetical protein [Nocardia sp. NPDC051570]|uniref:hypothetical protein n=1 Tax=Nocardia sp. NPDC051570 TaxID=3364324 RepID=UPI0037A74CCA
MRSVFMAAFMATAALPFAAAGHAVAAPTPCKAADSITDPKLADARSDIQTLCDMPGVKASDIPAIVSHAVRVDLPESVSSTDPAVRNDRDVVDIIQKDMFVPMFAIGVEKKLSGEEYAPQDLQNDLGYFGECKGKKVSFPAETVTKFYHALRALPAVPHFSSSKDDDLLQKMIARGEHSAVADCGQKTRS